MKKPSSAASAAHSFDIDMSSMRISPSKTNAIIYVRVSTLDQTKGYSLETQIQDCKRYALSNGLKITQIISETCSAGEMMYQRELLKILNEYSNIHLIVYSADRLSRNFYDFAQFEKTCNEKNIIFHIAQKNLISTVTADLKHITSDIRDAVTERNTLSRRIRNSVQYRKQNGLFYPTISKFGTKYIRDRNGKIARIADEIKEKNIKKVVNMLYLGGKCDKINSLLNEITNRKDNKMYNYMNEDEEVNEILKGNMSAPMVADFLNHLGVLRRNRQWNGQSILNLVGRT
jgi:site-specific DNA recombinase